jgi:hypothetical protein
MIQANDGLLYANERFLDSNELLYFTRLLWADEILLFANENLCMSMNDCSQPMKIAVYEWTIVVCPKVAVCQWKIAVCHIATVSQRKNHQANEELLYANERLLYANDLLLFAEWIRYSQSCIKPMKIFSKSKNIAMCQWTMIVCQQIVACQWTASCHQIALS